MISYVMPQDQLQQYLNERHSVILTDDYVPVDNLIAPSLKNVSVIRGEAPHSFHRP